MKDNFLRQLRDIQVQAKKIEDGRPTVNDVENFKKYADEMKAFIQQNIQIPEILSLESEIPNIPENKLNVKKGIVAYFAPAFAQYFKDQSYINDSMGVIKTIKGKFASIEFISKNIPT